MNHGTVFSSLPLFALFLALAPTAQASATWYVDGVNGSDSNNCMSSATACKTVGHAISLALPGDSIMVAAATYTENLTIAYSLTIVGSSAATAIVDGGGVNTVVNISSAGANVTLSKLTIRNGSTQAPGGGISNSSTLTIDNCTISGNRVGSTSSHSFGNGGGGIYNSGPLTINNSTISGNSATSYRSNAFGGGIYNSGALTINDSAIFGNSAKSMLDSSYGGGISNNGTLTISNSTISSNTIFGPHARGGGINGSAALQNSIVAYSGGGNPENCYGTMTSNGYNLSSDNTCDFNGTGDLNNTEPKLGTLGNYGGPTYTVPLLFGSPAIDAGNLGGCTDGTGTLMKTDQRGRPRPDKEDIGGCDMGAYERQTD